MRTEEVIKFFGSQSEAARRLGIKQPSVAAWDEFPPADRQLQIQAVTGGVLRAEPDAVDKFLGVKVG